MAKRVKWRQKVSYDLSALYLNPESIIHCDECKGSLGVMRVLRYALFKKRGSVYIVPCRYCAHLNKRVKCAYKKNVNEQWKEIQDKLKEQHDAGK